MAGRIRSIKPEIIEDEVAQHLSHLEYRIFTGTWLVADDYGNLRADPDYIRGQIVWGHPETREDVAKVLEHLVELDMLTPYTVRGQRYFHITNWKRHQKVDKPGKPRMPGPIRAEVEPDEPDELDPQPEEITVARPSRESRETPAPDLRSPTSDHEQGGDHSRESRGERAKAHPKILIPEGWHLADTPENRTALTRAKDNGVNPTHALAKFVERMKANGVRARDWDAKAREMLLVEFPTSPQLVDSFTRAERGQRARAAQDRERVELAERDRRANAERSEARQVLAEFLKPPEKATG